MSAIKKNIVDGYTLAHEHVTIDLSGAKGDDDCSLNLKDVTIEQFKKLYKNGVRNVIEVTNTGMGQNLEYIAEVEQQSGVNIIRSTGFYKEPYFPAWFYEKSREELADYMVCQINDFASIIAEIGTSKNKWEESEKKLFEAAVIAQKKTNVPISTHTTLGTLGLEQAQFFVNSNVNPDKVVIGHLDLSGNLDYIRNIIKMGFYVGFDTIGKNNYFPDDKRVKYLLELEQDHLVDHVVLSMDITRKSNLNKLGYNYVFDDFVPRCLGAGLSQKSIDVLLTNPERWLC